jgi:hypothetical protein
VWSLTESSLGANTDKTSTRAKTLLKPEPAQNRTQNILNKLKYIYRDGTMINLLKHAGINKKLNERTFHTLHTWLAIQAKLC